MHAAIIQSFIVVFTDIVNYIVNYISLTDTNTEVDVSLLQKKRFIQKTSIEQYQDYLLNELVSVMLTSSIGVLNETYPDAAIQNVYENKIEYAQRPNTELL